MMPEYVIEARTGHRFNIASPDIAAMCRRVGLPEPVITVNKKGTKTYEYYFARPRRWRFDYAWPDRMIAVEYEGIVAAKSRHTTLTGYTGDCQKYNAATRMGWQVYRFTILMIDSGEALELMKEVLSG